MCATKFVHNQALINEGSGPPRTANGLRDPLLYAPGAQSRPIKRTGGGSLGVIGCNDSEDAMFLEHPAQRKISKFPVISRL